MRILLALTGSLKQHMNAEIKAGKIATAAAIKAAVDEAKNDLRQQTRSAGLGNRLAMAWRGEVYPKGKPSLRAAGLVFTKAPKLIDGFAHGTVIRSRNGFWMAIPTEAAPKKGVGGKRISPSTFPEHVYGPLRFVQRTGKPALLVVDNQRARKGKRGGFTRASARAQARGEVATVAMFILVPQVRLKKRLSLDETAARVQNRLPRAILDAWERLSDDDE